MKRRIAFVFLIILVLAAPSGAVLAASYFDTVVEENETINNDVIVFDGDFEIQNGATINGDVIIFNGDASVAGTINGDLVIFNGDLETRGQANVNGDCVLLNGEVEDGSNSGIRCTTIEGNALSGFVKGIPAVPAVPVVPAVPAVPDVPAVPPVPPVQIANDNSGPGGAVADFMGAVGSSLLLGLLAFAVASIFPEHLEQVKTTVHRKPAASGAVGLLTAIAVPIIAAFVAVIAALLTIICIGILGFPIVMLILLALLAAILMGWIAVGTLFGQRLFRKNDWSLPMTAAVGTLLLTFGIGLLGMFSFIAGVLAVIFTSVGLGAVALTKFGRQPYPEVDISDSVEVDDDKVEVVLRTLPDDDNPIMKS